MSAEMTQRERIEAVSRKQPTDKLPFFHVWRYLPIGSEARECLNRGMGITWFRPSSYMKLHGVTVVEEVDRSEPLIVRRTFKTPVGSISLVEKRARGFGLWRLSRGWRGEAPWQRERATKTPEDYKVLKYIIENTEYVADYFPIEQAKEWLGDDGVVLDGMYGQMWDFIPHSPMQTLMIDWIGSEGGNCFVHMAKYPDLVDELYNAFSKSYEAMYKICAKSPADIVWYMDNIDDVLVNPRLFEKYFVPEYEKAARVLHAHGKLLAVHMDGRVNDIKDMIAKTPIDIIEALTPPPMCDLPIGEALSLWRDKVIWMGIPGSLYVMGNQAIKKSILDLLREVIPGDRLAITMSTENLVSNEHLRLVTSILEKAELPLTQEKIEQIERSVS